MESLEQEIRQKEMTLEMVAAGMAALVAWDSLPDARRTAANKVAMVYSAAEAAQRRACLKSA